MKYKNILTQISLASSLLLAGNSYALNTNEIETKFTGSVFQYSEQDGKPDVLPSRPASLGVSPRGATPFIRAGIDIDAPDVWASARYSHLRASERNSLR